MDMRTYGGGPLTAAGTPSQSSSPEYMRIQCACNRQRASSTGATWTEKDYNDLSEMSVSVEK